MEFSQIIDIQFAALGKICKIHNILVKLNGSFYYYNCQDNSRGVLTEDENKTLSGIYNHRCFDILGNNKNYIPDINEFISTNNLTNTEIESYFKENKVEALVIFPIVPENTNPGLVIITFNSKDSINTDDLALIEDTVSKFVLLINHVFICKNEKEIVKRDLIFRDITDKIRNSIALPEVKHEFINQMAKLLNADIVLFAEYNASRETYLVTKEAEYLSSSDIKSAVGLDTRDIVGFSEYIKSVHLQGKDIVFDNVAKYIEDNNLQGTGIDRFYREYSIGASAAVNIYYKELFLGNLMIAFNKERHISDDEIKLVKDISVQAGIALHHAMLYAKTRKSAQREVILRKISELISSSLDSESIKRKLLSFICEYLEADRCFIVDFNSEVSRFLPVQYEHRAKTEEKSLIGVDVCEEFPNFSELEYIKEDSIIPDVEAFQSVKGFAPEKEKLKEYNVKSDYALAILYAEKVVGALVVQYTQKKFKLDEEQLNILKHLASQTGIALYQTILYEKVLRHAEREKALRQIMLSSVTILDFEEVINFIVTEAGKLFKADRCFFVVYDDETETTFPIEGYAQYLSSDKIKSHLDIPVNKESVEKFVSAIRQKRIVIANNIYNEDLSKDSIEMLINGLSVKSYLVAPVFYGEHVYGSFVLHYVNEFRIFTEEDTDFAAAVANQAAVILKQNELFEKEREAAEREKENKNLIEIMRSSMDKSVVKKLFVKNLGKFFNADRVFICEYDSAKKKILPVENGSQYLALPDIKSYVGVDFADGNYTNFHLMMSEKKEIIIPSIGKFIMNNELSSVEINLLTNGLAKSSYTFPVVYEDKMLATFTIDFVQRETFINNEEISRIRKICAQLGIALDHANVYQKAQECNYLSTTFKNEVSTKVKDSANNIVDTSNLLIQNEFDRNVQIECLNNIIKSCNQLLELTK